jgi:hypothetical protein
MVLSAHVSIESFIIYAQKLKSAIRKALVLCGNSPDFSAISTATMAS